MHPSMTLRESIVARAAHAVERLSVKSALNPMLWLCGLVTIPTVVATLLVSPVPLWLIFLACMPVGAATAGFAFLLLFDRGKLRSESYQLRKQALDLIEEKGDVAAINASTSSHRDMRTRYACPVSGYRALSRRHRGPDAPLHGVPAVSVRVR